MQLVGQSPFLGDNTMFFEWGLRFSNLPASRGRSFCRSSNRLLGSMLVMFLRPRRWPVAPCAFHVQPTKRTLRMSTNLAFRPTFVLPVAEIVLPIVPHDGLACTVYRAVPGSAHYYLQGCHRGKK